MSWLVINYAVASWAVPGEQEASLAASLAGACSLTAAVETGRRWRREVVVVSVAAMLLVAAAHDAVAGDLASVGLTLQTASSVAVAAAD